MNFSMYDNVKLRTMTGTVTGEIRGITISNPTLYDVWTGQKLIQNQAEENLRKQ